MINECGSYQYQAEQEIESLKKLQEPLQKALQQWIENRTISEEIKVEGVTLQYIMDKCESDFTSALFLMSAFMDEPQDAVEFKSVPFFFYK